MSGVAHMLADVEDVLMSNVPTDAGIVRVAARLNLAGHLTDSQTRQLRDAMERRVPLEVTIILPPVIP